MVRKVSSSVIASNKTYPTGHCEETKNSTPEWVSRERSDAAILGGKALSLGRLLRCARNDGVEFFIRVVLSLRGNEVTWQSREARR